MNSNSESPVAESENSQEQVDQEQIDAGLLPPEPDPSISEYFQLQQLLLRFTVAIAGITFPCVWIAYSLETSLSYLIGACAGVIYLKMLSRSVAQLGRQRKQLGSGRLAVFIGLILIATQWQQLEVIPAFLGFLTYKAALIVYTLWIVLVPKSTQS